MAVCNSVACACDLWTPLLGKLFGSPNCYKLRIFLGSEPHRLVCNSRRLRFNVKSGARLVDGDGKRPCKNFRCTSVSEGGSPLPGSFAYRRDPLCGGFSIVKIFPQHGGLIVRSLSDFQRLKLLNWPVLKKRI